PAGTRAEQKHDMAPVRSATHGLARQHRRAVSEFETHYHRERNHQGVGNVLLFPKRATRVSSHTIKRRERLGGLLNFYHREAA
ncbi:MAG: hypothetical protein V3T05_12155, partial [Myxococcota bacterium]